MILLDDVIQVFTRPDLRLWTDHSTRLQLRDSCVRGGVSVERNPLRGAMPLCCAREETLGGGNISTLAQQKINGESLLIDSPVKVPPAPSNLDICFVHASGCADLSSIATPTLLELRDIALNPSQDGSVGDIDTALGHHLDQVSIAEFVSEIPADTENDDCAIRVATMKHRG